MIIIIRIFYIPSKSTCPPSRNTVVSNSAEHLEHSEDVMVFQFYSLGPCFSLCKWYSLFFRSTTVDIQKVFFEFVTTTWSLLKGSFFFSLCTVHPALHNNSFPFLLIYRSMAVFIYFLFILNGAQHVTLIIQVWLKLCHHQNRFYIYYVACRQRHN